MMKGTLFDIQRASFVDGPGLRTVVFFKGCNLQCQWCHNPESWRMRSEMLCYPKRCTHCGRCRAVCPVSAIDDNMDIIRTRCTACGKCAKACFSSAKMVCGYETDSDSVMKTILEDKPFYDPDGGATFSGGECMLQPDFLCELLQQCKAEGIHTAVDTAGNVKFAVFERVLPYTDLFLYDIKCINPEKHRKYTGVENRQILNNLAWLLDNVPDQVRIRVPVINDVNADEEEMNLIFDFLSSHPSPNGIDLLPYHRMGEGKHAALGNSSVFVSTPPSEDWVRKWQIKFNKIIDNGGFTNGKETAHKI